MPQSFLPPSLFRVAVVVCLLGLHGCVSSRHLPPGPIADVPSPAILKSRTAAVTGSFDTRPNLASPSYKQVSPLPEINTWFAPPAAGGSDYTVTVSGTNKMGGDFIGSFFLYLFSLGILPAWSTNTITSEVSIKSGNTEVFHDTEQTRIRSALSVFSPFAFFAGKPGSSAGQEGATWLLAAHRAALAHRVDQDRVAFEAAVQQGTNDAFDKYLAANPQSFFRGEALRGLSVLAARSRDPLAAHKTNLAHYPDYSRFIDGDQALWFVGPAGMQVVDIAPVLKKGTSPELLAAQIRAARQPYKVFTADELAWLKDKGIPDSVAAAMLDATTAANAAGVTAPATVSALPAATTAAALLGGQVSPAAPAPAGTPVAAAKPTLGDTATECAEKLAALKACEQVPFPGNLGCKVIAKQKFNNPACSVIQ